MILQKSSKIPTVTDTLEMHCARMSAVEAGQYHIVHLHGVNWESSQKPVEGTVYNKLAFAELQGKSVEDDEICKDYPYEYTQGNLVLANIVNNFKDTMLVFVKASAIEVFKTVTYETFLDRKHYDVQYLRAGMDLLYAGDTITGQDGKKYTESTGLCIKVDLLKGFPVTCTRRMDLDQIYSNTLNHIKSNLVRNTNQELKKVATGEVTHLVLADSSHMKSIDMSLSDRSAIWSKAATESLKRDSSFLTKIGFDSDIHDIDDRWVRAKLASGVKITLTELKEGLTIQEGNNKLHKFFDRLEIPSKFLDYCVNFSTVEYFHEAPEMIARYALVFSVLADQIGAVPRNLACNFTSYYIAHEDRDLLASQSLQPIKMLPTMDIRGVGDLEKDGIIKEHFVMLDYDAPTVDSLDKTES